MLNEDENFLSFYEQISWNLALIFMLNVHRRSHININRPRSSSKLFIRPEVMGLYTTGLDYPWRYLYIFNIETKFSDGS